MFGNGGLDALFQRELSRQQTWDRLSSSLQDGQSAYVVDEIQRFGVLMPNWLSEFIIALAVVTQKSRECDLQISLIVPERFVALCKKLTSLPVIPYNRKNNLQLLDSAALVREAMIDKLYLLPHSFSSAYFAFKTGVAHCRGISAEQRNQFLTEKVPEEISTKTEHLSKEYSAVLECRYIEPSAWTGVDIEKHPHFGGYAVLCPGAGDDTKRWTGFEELVKIWADQNFVILGDDSEVRIAKKIGQRLPHRVVNLTGQTSLEEAATIIAGASVVISNDSGLMQIASYCGTPVVSIFGGSSPSWRRPLGKNNKVITSLDAPCRFCFKKECAKKNFECLVSILPEDVIGAAMEIKHNAGV